MNSIQDKKYIIHKNKSLNQKSNFQTGIKNLV